jgi:hypothetical protein
MDSDIFTWLVRHMFGLITRKKAITDGPFGKGERYNVIRGRNEAEKRVRRFGDRSVEFNKSFVCNKSLTPGWVKGSS